MSRAEALLPAREAHLVFVRDAPAVGLHAAVLLLHLGLGLPLRGPPVLSARPRAASASAGTQEEMMS